MKKILLALQFFQRDQARAYRLARLIADWQPAMSKIADFCFVPRFDCEHDKSQNTYVGKKFTTFAHHGRRRAVGWPNGCNALWFDLMAKLCEKDGLGYKAVLTFEPDCTPLCQNWVEKLHEAWDVAGKPIVGDLLPLTTLADGTKINHINGNALFSCDPTFLKWLGVKEKKVRPTVGWDSELTKDFEALGWADTPAIRSDYRCKVVTGKHLENFLKEGVVFHHGCKTDDLFNLVKDRVRVTPLPGYVTKVTSLPNPDLA
jgi:hypothetical protein